MDRIDATVRTDQPEPTRCELRAGSAADGHGILASFKARAIRATEWPASRWANIHRTTFSVSGSGLRRCARRPQDACILFGCGPASASRYPYGGRPPSPRCPADVGRVRANARVQAEISEAAGALTQLRRTSTSTAGGDPFAIRGTRRRLSTPREAVRPRCRDVWHVPLTSGQSPPEGFQFLDLSCNDSKGTGKRCTLAHIDSKKHRYACTRSSCR